MEVMCTYSENPKWTGALVVALGTKPTKAHRLRLLRLYIYGLF
jgi:hypothetical protein